MYKPPGVSLEPSNSCRVSKTSILKGAHQCSDKVVCSSCAQDLAEAMRGQEIHFSSLIAASTQPILNAFTGIAGQHF